MTLKAGTLIESLIAMVILVVVLGMATMIYTNAMDSDQQAKKQKALCIAEKEIARIKSEKRFVDSETMADTWLVRSSFERYHSSDGLYRFSTEVTDENGKLLYSRNELIIQ
ncbi:MAG: hypothetical protein ACJ77K_06815 [Bacteroidia bacterium]